MGDSCSNLFTHLASEALCWQLRDAYHSTKIEKKLSHCQFQNLFSETFLTEGGRSCPALSSVDTVPQK